MVKVKTGQGETNLLRRGLWGIVAGRDGTATGSSPSGEKRYGAVRLPHEFACVEIVDGTDVGSGDVYWQAGPAAQPWRGLHRARRASTARSKRGRLLADIEGAQIAEANAASTAWVLKHTQPGTHHDQLLAIVGAVRTQFAPHLTDALIKRFEATNRSARAVAEERHAALCKVEESVLEKAVAAEKGRHLGYYHQDPHPAKGHVLSAVDAAIAAVKVDYGKTPALLATWRKAAADVAEINTFLDGIGASVDTRAAKAAAAKTAAQESDAE